MIDVNRLLEGVDLWGVKRTEPGQNLAQRPQLFYSYSRKHEGLRNQLETRLKLLERRGLISSWHDRKLLPGQDWAEEIDANLERSSVILLLVSAEYLASDYCNGKEMKVALERQAKDDAIVIPIIVRDVKLAGTPLSQLQVLPKDARAVTLWKDRDKARRDVSDGTESAILAKWGHP